MSSKFEGAPSAAHELPQEEEKPKVREAEKGDKPRDLIELPEEAMKEFDQKSAEMALNSDPNLNRHLAIAAEAKREAEKVKELFRHMKKPYTDAWELALKLRKYDFELEDALFEAYERPELQRNLKPAQEELTEIIGARKKIQLVLMKIQKAVEDMNSEREEARTKEEEEKPDEVDSALEFMDVLGDATEIRRNLEKGKLDAEARGTSEETLSSHKEAIHSRIQEINDLPKEEGSKPAHIAAYKAAEQAEEAVNKTLHALFEADRESIHENTGKYAEQLSQLADDKIEDAVNEMAPHELASEEIIDALDNLKAGELQQIPGNIEATKERSEEVNSFATHIRSEITRYEQEGVYEARPFINEIGHLDRIASELDERLELLYGKDDHTKDEKKEFEIIADAKHEIQDLRHEIKSYEQGMPQKEIVMDKELEKRAGLNLIKKHQLESLAEKIKQTIEKKGMHEYGDEYLGVQSFSSFAKIGRWLGGFAGKKYPKLTKKETRDFIAKMVKIQSEFETEYHSSEERKDPKWKKKFHDRARLNIIPKDVDLFELWRTIHAEIDETSGNIPPSLAAASAFGEGEAKAKARENEEPEAVRREQRGAAEDYRAQHGLSMAETEEKFFKEPEDIVKEQINAATKAGVKNAKFIWNQIMKDPAAPDMKYQASEVVDQMTIVAGELSQHHVNKDALHEATLKLAEIQEDLLENMGGVKTIDDLILKANKALGIAIHKHKAEAVYTKKEAEVIAKSKKKKKARKPKAKKKMKMKKAA